MKFILLAIVLIVFGVVLIVLYTMKRMIDVAHECEVCRGDWESDTKEEDTCEDKDCEIYVLGGFHRKGVVELCKYSKKAIDNKPTS